jgi:hypothetical protein
MKSYLLVYTLTNKYQVEPTQTGWIDWLRKPQDWTCARASWVVLSYKDGILGWNDRILQVSKITSKLRTKVGGHMADQLVASVSNGSIFLESKASVTQPQKLKQMWILPNGVNMYSFSFSFLDLAFIIREYLIFPFSLSKFQLPSKLLVFGTEPGCLIGSEFLIVIWPVW